jgi:hypothetical protein
MYFGSENIPICTSMITRAFMEKSLQASIGCASIPYHAGTAGKTC